MALVLLSGAPPALLYTFQAGVRVLRRLSVCGSGFKFQGIRLQKNLGSGVRGLSFKASGFKEIWGLGFGVWVVEVLCGVCVRVALTLRSRGSNNSVFGIFERGP